MEEDHCFNNWDLDAVVRLACRRRLSPPPLQVNDPFDSLPPPPQQQRPPAAPYAAPVPANELKADAGWRFPDLRAGGGQDGDELLRALAAQPPVPPPLPTLPPPPPVPQQQQQPVLVSPAEVPAQARAGPASVPARAQPSGRQVPGGAVPRSKRRKNQVKKVVCHVPANGSSSDVWAWRKYGQKPIKGSPYPRGYYRCSSSKGCAARKQVERCRTDPNTFILTFTGDHNHAAPTHRNSLAGTTRHKFPSTASSPPPSVVVGSSESQQQQQQPSPSPPSKSAGLSPTTPLRTPSMEEDDNEEEDELLVEDMEMAGEDELLVEDMEMAGEDELLFLNGGADFAAPLERMSSLFDVVDERFLGSPCATAAPDAGS